MVNFLIFARRTDIRSISLDVEYYADVLIPVGELKNVIAIDVDRDERELHKNILQIIKYYSSNSYY